MPESSKADLCLQSARSPVGIPAFTSFETAYSLPGRFSLGFDEGLSARGLSYSMSAYGKASQASDYNPRSPQTQQQQQQYSSLQQQPTYGTYTSQSHYSTPSASQPPARHRPIVPDQPTQHQQQPLNEPLYSPRQYSELPHILGFDPRTSVEGALFTVYLHSSLDLTTDPWSFRIVFGSHRCNPSTPKAANRPNEYQISTTVPAHQSTAWRSPLVKVYLLTEDDEEQQLGKVEVGGFTYTDVPSQQSYASPPRATLKRKASVDSGDLRSPAKRSATQPLRPKSEDYGTYGYTTPSSNAQYTPYITHTSNDRSYGVYSAYEPESTHSAAYQPQASPRNYSSYTYAGQSDLSHPSSAPSAQGWASQFTPAPADNTSILPPSSETPNPTLIRTSTIQVDKGGEGSSGRAPGPGFNPYALYPHKAVLKIQGELDDMSKRWTAEEWDSKRRLVRFWRQQKGSTIHATFRPVPQSEWPTSAVCISCIWWAERGECFVTSVDCIYLLESLIAVRFTVEEKNRIRRNLEGFHPLTVSKGKKECESFFKLIMQFPSPKPRNIEKDVKVFSWSSLSQALKKIIGKYSASYSSTASIIPPAIGASPYPGAPPHEAHPRPSERTTSSPGVIDSIGSTASSAVNTMLAPATVLQVHTTPTRTTSPVIRTGAAASDSHISLPGIVTATNAHSMWQQSQALPTTPHSLSSTSHRTSWDVAPFLDATSTSSSGYYQRDHASSADERVPVSAITHPSPQTTNGI